jgi:hypothetical protein
MTGVNGIVFPVSKNSPHTTEQPPIKPGNQGVSLRTPPGFVGGSGRSVARLKQLGFDPIERLVVRHQELTAELELQKKKRDGTVIELRADGKPKAFVMDHLLGLHDRLTAIEKELLRYGYGRVNEGEAPEKPKGSSLVINLTKKGDSYVLNEDAFAPQTDEQPDGMPPWD